MAEDPLAEHLRKSLAMESRATLAPTWPTTQGATQALSDSWSLLASVVFLTTAGVLLAIRPPFVMSFEVDRQRPWRSVSSVSWISLLSSSAISTVVALLLPWLLEGCMKS